jgi:hypothetical protein
MTSRGYIRFDGHIDHFEKQLYLPITYIERNPIYIYITRLLLEEMGRLFLAG